MCPWLSEITGKREVHPVGSSGHGLRGLRGWEPRAVGMLYTDIMNHPRARRVLACTDLHWPASTNILELTVYPRPWGGLLRSCGEPNGKASASMCIAPTRTEEPLRTVCRGFHAWWQHRNTKVACEPVSLCPHALQLLFLRSNCRGIPHPTPNM